MQARLDGVKEKVKDIPEADRVKVMYYEASYSADGMLCAYGEGSPFQAIAEAAGARNVCTAPLYSNVSKETVVNDWKPQVLVVSGVTYGADFSATEDGGAAMKAAILADATLKTVPAVADRAHRCLTKSTGDRRPITWRMPRRSLPGLVTRTRIPGLGHKSGASLEPATAPGASRHGPKRTKAPGFPA